MDSNNFRELQQLNEKWELISLLSIIKLSIICLSRRVQLVNDREPVNQLSFFHFIILSIQ